MAIRMQQLQIVNAVAAAVDAPDPVVDVPTRLAAQRRTARAASSHLASI